MKLEDFEARMNNKEAAKYLGMSPATLSRMRCEKRGPRYIKVGRSIFYTEEQLNDYLKGVEISPEIKDHKETD